MFEIASQNPIRVHSVTVSYHGCHPWASRHARRGTPRPSRLVILALLNDKRYTEYIWRWGISPLDPKYINVQLRSLSRQLTKAMGVSQHWMVYPWFTWIIIDYHEYKGWTIHENPWFIRENQWKIPSRNGWWLGLPPIDGSLDFRRRRLAEDFGHRVEGIGTRAAQPWRLRQDVAMQWWFCAGLHRWFNPICSMVLEYLPTFTQKSPQCR